MAPSLPKTTRGRVSVSAIEKAMGIKWPRGLSRHKGRLKIPIIWEVEREVRHLVGQYSVLSLREILVSDELEAAANKIFEAVGPRMWPDATDDPFHYRFEWLANASLDSLEGHYSKDLHYSVDQDRQQLRQSFYNLVIAKCMMYIKNHPGWKPHRLEGNELDDPIELSDEGELEDPGDSEYTPKSRRYSRSMQHDDGPARGRIQIPPVSEHQAYDESLASLFGEAYHHGARVDDPSYPLSPASVAPFRSSSKKRRLSADRATDTKRAREGDLVRSNGPHRLIVVLKLTPRKLAASRESKADRVPDALLSHFSTTEIDSLAKSSKQHDPYSAKILHDTPGKLADPSSIRQSVESLQQPGPSDSSQSAETLVPPDHVQFAYTILGDHIGLPVVQQLLRSDKELSKDQLETLKLVFDRCPGARTSKKMLHDELSKVAAAVGPEPKPQTAKSFTPIEGEDGPAEDTAVPVGDLPGYAYAIRALSLPSHPDAPDITGTTAAAQHAIADEQSSHNDTQPETATQCDGPSNSAAGVSTGDVDQVPRISNGADGETEEARQVRGSSLFDSSQSGDGAQTATEGGEQSGGDNVHMAGVQPSASTQVVPELPDASANDQVTTTDVKDVALHQPSLPSAKPTVDGPEQGRSLEPDLTDILERAEVEIDWASADEFPSFIPLEACKTVEDLFARIDEQIPRSHRQQLVEAVKVEHVNHEGKGKSVNCRIIRAGAGGLAAFRIMLRRLRQLDADTYPELKVTVEWCSARDSA